jgi:putative spermidine/putrescine transport system substrate-binding protein
MRTRQGRWLSTGIAAAVFVLAIGSQASLAAETLVIAGWGGPYEPELRKNGIIPEFEKKHNVKVSWLSMSSYQNYGRIKSQRANPQVDIALLDRIVQTQAAKEGLFEKLDPSIVTSLPDIKPSSRLSGDVGVGFGILVTGMYYNHKIFKEKGFAPPTSWLDFYRPELSGRIIMRHITSQYGLYPMLMLNRIAGGDENNIEPGFEQMKKLAPHVMAFPTSGGKTRQFMLTGDAWMSASGATELHDMTVRKGAPLTFFIPKEGAIPILETVNVIKNAPHPKLAQQFVEALINADAQYKIALAWSWVPVHKKVPIDEAIRKAIPIDITKPLNLVSIDFAAAMKDRAEWTERFNKEIAK